MNPYDSQPRTNGLSQHMTRLMVATVIPIFGLFLLRTVLAALPMIRNAGPIGDLNIAPLVMVKAAIDTVIYFLILRCSMGASQILKSARPHLAEIGTMILLAGCALVAVLAYSGYEVLMASLAPAQMEAYNWIFLAVVLTPIAVIVVMVTRRLDFFSNLVFGKLNEAVAQPPAGRPPVGASPSSAANEAEQRMQARVQTLSGKVSQAGEAVDRLRTQGRLSAELAESSLKVHEYLLGAQQSLANRDLDAAKGFADWADYEASRLLMAAQ